jgi:hypothetical protein
MKSEQDIPVLKASAAKIPSLASSNGITAIEAYGFQPDAEVVKHLLNGKPPQEAEFSTARHA